MLLMPCDDTHPASARAPATATPTRTQALASTQRPLQTAAPAPLSQSDQYAAIAQCVRDDGLPVVMGATQHRPRVAHLRVRAAGGFSTRRRRGRGGFYFTLGDINAASSAPPFYHCSSPCSRSGASGIPAVAVAQDFLSRATRCNCCRRSTNASRCETGDLRKDTSRVFVSTCRVVRCHARVANGELDLSAQAPKVSLGSSDCSATACATASTYDGSCSQLSPGAQPTCSPQKSAGAAPHRQGQRHAACAETGSRLF